MLSIDDMWITPGPRPNGLQAADDGLWVIDAENSHIYKLDYETGEAMLEAPTDTYKSSGMTVGDGVVWVASTHNSRLYKLNEDGLTLLGWGRVTHETKALSTSGPMAWNGWTTGPCGYQSNPR